MFSLLKNRKLTLRMIWMKESMKATDPKEAKERQQPHVTLYIIERIKHNRNSISIFYLGSSNVSAYKTTYDKNF